MGGLIDRKLLLENLQASRLHHAKTSKEMSLLIRCENIVIGQPAAYDVDKVIGRLEIMRDTAVKNIELNSQSYDIKDEIESVRKHYEWIIQVVKSGWKE